MARFENNAFFIEVHSRAAYPSFAYHDKRTPLYRQYA